MNQRLIPIKMKSIKLNEREIYIIKEILQRVNSSLEYDELIEGWVDGGRFIISLDSEEKNNLINVCKKLNK